MGGSGRSRGGIRIGNPMHRSEQEGRTRPAACQGTAPTRAPDARGCGSTRPLQAIAAASDSQCASVGGWTSSNGARAEHGRLRDRVRCRHRRRNRAGAATSQCDRRGQLHPLSRRPPRHTCPVGVLPLPAAASLRVTSVLGHLTYQSECSDHRLHERHCVSVHLWRQDGRTPPVSKVFHE
jgi:hypothetical protein